jgi:ribonuclease HI
LKPIKIKIQIEVVENVKIGCYIFNETENNRLEFSLSDGNITLEKENNIADLFRNNKIQFEKIIRSAIKGNIKPGQTISCVFIEGFNFISSNDFTKYIRVDRRNAKLNITVSNKASTEIHKIYADGSFAGETKKAGYGGFTEDPYGKQEIFFRSFDGGSSNLMELLAISDGLQRLQTANRLQVFTDSQYVIRGLVQWCHFWQYNNWQTAHGKNVKYAKHWQTAFSLCEDKFVEFKWIKGHSGNMEQDFCHQLAKELTTQ